MSEGYEDRKLCRQPGCQPEFERSLELEAKLHAIREQFENHFLPNYNYLAEVERWVDGDTVDLDIDLGFHVHIKARCRLDDIDTPERGRPNWAEATAFAASVAPIGSQVYIYSKLPADKYGRFLITVYTSASSDSVNEQLVQAGLARYYDGGKR